MKFPSLVHWSCEVERTFIRKQAIIYCKFWCCGALDYSIKSWIYFSKLCVSLSHPNRSMGFSFSFSFLLNIGNKELWSDCDIILILRNCKSPSHSTCASHCHYMHHKNDPQFIPHSSFRSNYDCKEILFGSNYVPQNHHKEVWCEKTKSVSFQIWVRLCNIKYLSMVNFDIKINLIFSNHLVEQIWL